MASPRVPSPDKLQLLGVAFASADLAFELDQEGLVTFAIGAVKQTLGLEARDIVGRGWRDFVEPAEQARLGLMLADLASGERRRGIQTTCLSLDARRAVTSGELAIFRLPDKRVRISCAFRQGHGDRVARPSVGLLDRAAFEAAARSVLDEAVASAGRFVVQDEASSVVWGMPGAAAETGRAEKVLPLDEVGPWMRHMASAPAA